MAEQLKLPVRAVYPNPEIKFLNLVLKKAGNYSCRWPCVEGL
jgi:hypothetical protein